MERQGVFDAVRRQLRVQLEVVSRGRERELLERWARRCRGLCAADVAVPGDVVAWVWALPTTAADEVLRGLVSAAQGGDRAAAMVVILCLEPGICRIATRHGQSYQRVDERVDEVVSELALRLYEFPLQRRRAVAAGLLRDVRARLWRDAGETRRCVPSGLRPDMVGRRSGDGNSVLWMSRSSWLSTAEQVVSLVSRACQDGALQPLEARLLVETRVFGERCSDAARRMGLTASACYHRRARAEAELARRYGDPRC